jgi:NAD(P)H-dependent flavin oxidoreductase YrpB (nitropropane dioxygenase family)
MITMTGAPDDVRSTKRGPPRIVQGGMGVAISGWQLAAAVAATGQLGVVSGTALEVVCARRLQGGDPGGHVRRALAAFPVPSIAEWILDAYFVEGGKPDEQMFRAVPRYTLAPPWRLQELTAAANFVEVYLAKQGAGQGSGGPVGVNYLRKIEMPLPAACYGAMLAGVDYVLMGAGNPAELPELLRRLARHQDVRLGVRVQQASSADGPYEVHFSPTRLLGHSDRAPLPAPKALAIVASVDLARALATDPTTRPDGFVLEGPSAGGHNAPPRGPRRTDAIGQPMYDQRDEVDLPQVIELGLPVWLAGSYATPERLRAALDAGAAGVQVGTAFAYCQESGFAPDIKHRVLQDVKRGAVRVRSDWRCSPTGFPFRVVELADTLSDPSVREDRQAVCDLGMLRTAYLTPVGKVDYRCPAEPAQAYLGRKGGRETTRQGRVCVCNALLASAGLPQRRPNGYLEPPLVTAGSDFTTVTHLVKQLPPGRATYPAADVVAHLLHGAE